MRDLVIDHNIPIPTENATNLADQFPEFTMLEIGDSFVIPEKQFPLHVRIGEYSRSVGRKHEVRRLPDRNYRVWRTA